WPFPREKRVKTIAFAPPRGQFRPGPAKRPWEAGFGMDEGFRKGALDYHRSPRPGKLSVEATKRMANQRDLALAYSPGVAAPCLEIAANPATARDYTA